MCENLAIADLEDTTVAQFIMLTINGVHEDFKDEDGNTVSPVDVATWKSLVY